MIIQGQVNAPPSASLADGTQPPLLAGRAGETIATLLHGKHYTQNYRGNVFIGSTAAAGVAIASITATAQTYEIWNPLGSGKNIIPLQFRIGAAVAASVTGGFCLGYSKGIGNGIGTPITAYTAAAPVCGLIGANASSAIFVPATLTFSAAQAALNAPLPNLLISVGTGAVSVYGAAPLLIFDMDGSLIIGPGTLITVGAPGTAALTASITCIWEEVPS